MSNNGPVLSRGSNTAVDCCRHSSLKRMISDKTMIVYARAAIDFRTLAQYSSHDGNILQYMEHALYIKWICSSPPFGSIESIHATRTNLSISPFQSSMP